jgi:hypothetical protein
VLGGIQAFGLIGIVVGPPIMAIFISLMGIVRDFEADRKYVTVIEPPRARTTTSDEETGARWNSMLMRPIGERGPPHLPQPAVVFSQSRPERTVLGVFHAEFPARLLDYL